MEDIEGVSGVWNHNYCNYPKPKRCNECRKVIPYDLELNKEICLSGIDEYVPLCPNCFLQGLNFYTLCVLFTNIVDKINQKMKGGK